MSSHSTFSSFPPPESGTSSGPSKPSQTPTQQPATTTTTTSSSSSSSSHSHTRKPSASNPIVRPGPNAQGPAGYEERLADEQTASNNANKESRRGSIGGSVKDKLRHVGEKFAFVQPKSAETLGGERVEAARQDASTGPE